MPQSRSRGRGSKAHASNLEVGQKSTRQVPSLSESFHVWKNATHGAHSQDSLGGSRRSARRDSGTTGQCPLKGVGAGGGGGEVEMLKGNMDGAQMPLSLQVTVKRSRISSSHGKVKHGQPACYRRSLGSGLSSSRPQTNITALHAHFSP